jgi:hypothetical protein
MKSRRRFEWLFTALLSVALSTGAAFAQNEGQSQDQGAYPPPDAQAQPNYPDQGAQQNYPDQGAAQGPYQQGQPQEDPSGRVARVQYMDGQVSTQPGGANDWVAANMNRPLTTSDRIWTDKNSKAELNVGDGFLRMNSETSLTLTNISDNTVQLELDQGTLSVTVRHLEAGEIYEVDTPNYAFTITKSGSYRFDVYPNEDQSWVTVRSGQGEATGKGASVKVTSGQQVRFSNGSSLTHLAEAAPARDGFDDWVQVRDKRLDDSLSARYVSPGVIGYQDLDANGTWAPNSPYGPVWTPTGVPAGWAPYRYGQWQWIAPWGWTWVDSASWGFAPFHYGRWVNWNGAWAWSPGPQGYWNPYYAPALVGWVGGPGFGIGIGWGGGWGWGGGFGVGIGFGWFPLGWGQPYYPRYCGWGHGGGWYHGGGYVTGNYFRNVNVTNTHINNINNVSHNYYNNNTNAIRNTNAIARNGVTSASKAAFTSGAMVNKVGGAVPSSALNNAHLMNTANANPTHSSVTGGQSPRTTGVPSNNAGSRSVVTRATPPATRPANIESASAHNNSNSVSRGNTTSANDAAHETGVNNGSRTAMNGANNTSRPSANNTEAARGTTPANGTQARTNAPGNSASSSVPHPSTGGSTYNSANAAQSHNNVPRPPASNDSFARANGNTATSAANRGSATTANNERYGTSNPAANSASRVGGSQYPRAGSASSVPRPPSSYQYHAAPSYSASSNYGHPSSGSSGYGASGRGYSSPSSSYGRSSYGSTPSYSANRGYSASPGYSAGRSSTPSYSARSYGSSPSYSARSYSAPHASGGSSYHSSGGGSSHSSGGGGGSHGGGGGGGHGGGGHR